MKITRRQLRKIIQEVSDISGINLPNMNAEGFFDLVPAGYVSRRPTGERISYGINGVTGSSGGRNMGYIAIASFHAAQTQNWGKPGNPAPMPVEHYAKNAGRVWSNLLRNDHGADVSPQQITNGLLNGTIRIQMNEPPRDVYVSYNESRTRSDINRIISREIRRIFSNDDKIINEGTSLSGLKKLLDYLTQTGIKYSPAGAMLVAYEKGDELINLITKDELDKAADLFMDTYKQL